MKHEVLFLNSSRAYVLVEDTWYDTTKESNPRVGESFLLGRIEKVLDYETYTKKYPESKQEIYNEVTDKTISGGYLRRVVNGMVKYAVNPATPTVGSNVKAELVED
jgi:hypothetical protein